MDQKIWIDINYVKVQQKYNNKISYKVKKRGREVLISTPDFLFLFLSWSPGRYPVFSSQDSVFLDII